eukprot:Plantae.Rhodophyta-Purpureofilum_apyrenoidigerum.ctg30035.p1 GENE.Plantae.Rhodophyta-Purpureofilum_apyrenoidigerum.ctg30035~~Plantae.Rhodophyta-Purpureofilum_apyrenoidigerum.ctg30035.p1  ORF type:complete len:886 (-),score=191.27 Plantae.Rhodophyta-Purpureofilum_apyrenoidigerum.ctg30035:108-2441(-)
MELKDLNPHQSPFQRTFAAEVKRCEEMQRRLRFLFQQVEDLNGVSAPEQAEYSRDRLKSLRLDDLDAHLVMLEKNLTQMNVQEEALRMQLNERVEHKYVLEKCAEFFRDVPRSSVESTGTYGDSRPMLNFIAGVLEREKLPAFERLLFRATRGNCHLKFADVPKQIIDPLTGEEMHKAVFVAFFSGDTVREKTNKICNAFAANQYPFPYSHDQQMNMFTECRSRLKDLEDIMATTARQKVETLSEIAARLPLWSEKVFREKAVFHTLNLLNYDTSHKLFIGEGWCPANRIEDVRTALDEAKRKANAQVPSMVEKKKPSPREKPPTYYRTNKFTEVFQNIVESYGVAQYHEVNPAPFSVITFPFLFAVMFGDVGHGILMTLMALLVISKERRLQNTKDEILSFIVTGRYIILLMGIFSIFTGLIYNEFFAIPLDLFSSRWKFTNASNMACGIDNCDVPEQVLPPLSPYPLGFDPVWKSSPNALLFFNSYKMKLSIVLGVTQMLLGIFLSYVNARFFRDPLDIWYVFVPQMIFMNAIFGYLVVLILLKWTTNWNSYACVSGPGCEPPDLKAVLIGMFMSPGNVPPKLRLYEGQAFLQTVLLLVALIAVPWMLLPKPFLLKARFERRNYAIVKNNSDLELQNGEEEEEDEHSGPFNFGDVLVNQMIHTIEFVLGAVSNTASYLRLWALSLAHAELSDVFLEKVLYGSINTGSAIAIIVGFSMWFGATLAVLMGMEALSAFLHALRLHWVEFQNKFYNIHGPGQKFEPFDFAKLRQIENPA